MGAKQIRKQTKSPVVTVRVLLQGISPMQMHCYDDEAIRETYYGRSRVLPGQKPEPREAAHSAGYFDGEDHPYIPTDNLFQCIMDGGKHVKCGRGKWTTTTSSKIPAVLEVTSDPDKGEAAGLPVNARNGKGFVPAPWEIHAATPKNATGGKSVSWRPVFNEWFVQLYLRIDTDYLPELTAREIVDAAGRWEGIGPQRPARKGRYGRFIVAEWEPLEVAA